MQGLPAVSCICLTYGRPAILAEAIESFLQQDYQGRKELIVLNDYVDQILTFDHPEVRVINVPKRFRTVGEKMNAAVALAAMICSLKSKWPPLSKNGQTGVRAYWGASRYSQAGKPTIGSWSPVISQR